MNSIFASNKSFCKNPSSLKTTTWVHGLLNEFLDWIRHLWFESCNMLPNFLNIKSCRDDSWQNCLYMDLVASFECKCQGTTSTRHQLVDICPVLLQQSDNICCSAPSCFHQWSRSRLRVSFSGYWGLWRETKKVKKWRKKKILLFWWFFFQKFKSKWRVS